MTNPVLENLHSQSLRQWVAATLLLCFGLTITFVLWQQATIITPKFEATLNFTGATLTAFGGVCVSFLMVAFMVINEYGRSRAVAIATKPRGKANLIAIGQQWMGKTSKKAQNPETCLPVISDEIAFFSDK